MERLKGLTKVVYILAALLVFEIGMLIAMIPQKSTQIWLSLGILTIICIYLISVSLRLLKEMKNNLKE